MGPNRVQIDQVGAHVHSEQHSRGPLRDYDLGATRHCTAHQSPGGATPLTHSDSDSYRRRSTAQRCVSPASKQEQTRAARPARLAPVRISDRETARLKPLSALRSSLARGTAARHAAARITHDNHAKAENDCGEFQQKESHRGDKLENAIFVSEINWKWHFNGKIIHNDYCTSLYYQNISQDRTTLLNIYKLMNPIIPEPIQS